MVSIRQTPANASNKYRLLSRSRFVGEQLVGDCSARSWSYAHYKIRKLALLIKLVSLTFFGWMMLAEFFFAKLKKTEISHFRVGNNLWTLVFKQHPFSFPRSTYIVHRITESARLAEFFMNSWLKLVSLKNLLTRTKIKSTYTADGNNTRDLESNANFRKYTSCILCMTKMSNKQFVDSAENVILFTLFKVIAVVSFLWF